MAYSKCGSCGSGSFEIAEPKIRGSAYRLYFVQCSSCGVPVALQEYNNITAMLAKQNEALKQIAAQVGVYVDL